MVNDEYSVKKKYITLSNILLTLYTTTLVCDIFTRSMFLVDKSSLLLHLRFVCIIMMAVFSLLGESHSKFDWICLFLGVLATIRASDTNFLLMILLLFSVKNLSPKLVLKATFFTIMVSLIIIMISSKLGIIINNISFRDGIFRQSLGMQFPLIFSGYVFLAFISWCLLDQGKRKLLTCVFAVILVLFLDKITNSRNDEICIILASIISFVPNNSKKIIKKETDIVILILFIGMVVSVFINEIIPLDTNLGFKLDKLLSGRLGLQSTLFQYYHPTIFPQNIVQNGWGGKYTTALNYFYIDNSFTRFLFLGGILFFLIIVTIVFKKMLELSQNNMYKVALFLALIILNGIVADSFSILTTSLLLPMFGISNYQYKKDFVLQK